MWKNPYTSLTISGKEYTKEALLSLTTGANTLPNWQQVFYQFIQEWLSEKDFIQVTTSGSTGTPKQIRLSKEKMVNSARMTGSYFSLDKNQTALLCLPCEYIAGKMMVVRSFVWGLNLLPVAPAGDPIEKIETVIDFAAMIPMQVSTLLDQSPQKKDLLKKIIIGGGKVNNQLLQQLQTVSAACYATYGMTETITHIAIQRLNGERQQPFFQALPNVQLSMDARGCLVIDAPLVSDDKIVTNDIVEWHGQNQFIWKGRFDNVINTGGVKVFPEQIEKKLEKFISTRFFVSSLPDGKLGQKVILIIENKSINTLQNADFQENINKVLSRFEKPKVVYTLPKFEETPTGKIQRNRTKALLKLS